MANPKVKFKRSSVAGKRPSLVNLELGELALNTFDGNLFTRQDTSGIGIGTTVTLLNPWQESYGGGQISYNGDVNVSGAITAISFYGDGSNLTGISVGINTSNVSSNTTISGIITATSQFYPPVLTTAERDTLSVNPGALIFNSTESKLQVYLGSVWASLTTDIDPYSVIGF